MTIPLTEKIGVLSKQKNFWRRFRIFLAVMGPGIITANVDNDAGGITTYTLAGAHFGNMFLWTMLPITVVLVLAQEMVARLGVVTGKGLADLIRENYGVKVTFYLMTALIAANFGNVVAEFAGVAAGMGIFGVSKVLSVVCAAIFVWWLVTQRDYKGIEKVFLVGCLAYATYIFSGYFVKPDWNQTLRNTFTPQLRWDAPTLTMFVGLIGTTIAPWMQFYQQSAMVDKGLQSSDYRYARWDVFLGCCMTNIVAFFIILTCSYTLFREGIQVEDASQAALALKPLAGQYCSALFAFGLVNASIFAACILPLSTAYCVCEGMGWQTGLDRKFEEAPQFYGLYSLLIAFGALTVCWPGFPLIKVMYWSQVINGLLLPVILALCLLLSNKAALMGTHKNPLWFNVIAWTAVVGVSFLSIAMVVRMLS